MRDCTECKWAIWDRTPAGKLHPKGGGECTYEYQFRPMPGYVTPGKVLDLQTRSRAMLARPNVSRHARLHRDCPYYEVKK